MTLVSRAIAPAGGLWRPPPCGFPPPPGLTGEAAYYEAASRAEARFLTGELEAARVTLNEALACAPQAFAAHASTLRQLEMLCRETGSIPAWLSPFRPPVCAHFTGHILDASREGALTGGQDSDLRREADRVVREQGIGFAYGGLAAGADIVFAEALLEAGAELHLVLPVNRDSFVAVSVAPFGAIGSSASSAASPAPRRCATPRRIPMSATSRFSPTPARSPWAARCCAPRPCRPRRSRQAVWDGHPAGTVRRRGGPGLLGARAVGGR
jgi:hypothetical protein